MSDSTDPLRAIIVGGGFSGTLVAIHLLRQGNCVHIDLIDPRIPGRGLAYSTAWDDHLLNVPAIRMSAFGSEPMHFLEWLQANGKPDADANLFAPRRLYGSYLQDVLETSIRAASGRCTFRHHMGEAVHAWSDSISVYVLLRNGERIQGAKLVLACGNPPPRALASHIDTPWAPGAFANLDRERDVLLIGAGLTAVDAFLALQAQGHRGRVHFVSRRGKLPHAHQPYRPLPNSFSPSGAMGARLLLREIRRHVRNAEAEGVDWRAVIDSMRPVTNDIWRQLEPCEQRRVLRHLKTWWDIHRHRMAPEIGAKIAAAQAVGRIVVHAGRLKQIPSDGRAEISLRAGGAMALDIQRIINCTGSDEDYRQTANPLMRSLLASGRIAANPIGKGLHTSEHGELYDADGASAGWLLTLGPPRLGGLFETTAVPELRKQAEALALYLSSVIYEPIEIVPELFMAAGI
ncbi:MAG TPA: FAD/NAD(P)-binding protein [Bryobacteraceae bacterium]